MILFDGVCNLCNGTVVFVIRRDPSKRFRFASLQSSSARTLLSGAGVGSMSMESLVLIQDGVAWTRSSAALRIARQLSGLWPCLYGLAVVPRPIRDWIYDAVARNRYRWFGRRDLCFVPDEDQSDRFLELT